MRPSLKESITRTCSHCDGAGVVKSEESQTIQIIRLLQRICAIDDVATIQVTVDPCSGDSQTVQFGYVEITSNGGNASVMIIVEPIPALVAVPDQLIFYEDGPRSLTFSVQTPCTDSLEWSAWSHQADVSSINSLRSAFSMSNVGRRDFG